MPKPRTTAQAGPNLWHISALSWGTSNLLLSLFAMPISFNQTGLRLQLGLMLAHFAGVIYLWRLATRRSNPERLLYTALVTLAFIYLVPLCMLLAPVIVLAAYALPSPAWETVVAILLAVGVVLTTVRIWSTAMNKDTGRRFECFLADELNENVISTRSIGTLLTSVGRHAIGPTCIDGWSMTAAVVAGAPILAASIDYDKSSSSLAICALITTPMAMHAFSRMVVHTYLWIFRLARFEREVGFKIVIHIRK
jgi:hypothetical protein